ncbi:hypothetical protein [Candidatus Poriferisodalis sp.]
MDRSVISRLRTATRDGAVAAGENGLEMSGPVPARVDGAAKAVL